MNRTATSPPIDTPFGFTATAADVLEEVDLTGKRALVTGASSGIGSAIATALACAGAAVTLTARDMRAGARVVDAIAAQVGDDGRAVAVHLDLADRASISTFVSGWSGPLDILVNNAGVSLPTLQRTPEGIELTFAVCHLGHFALARGLHDALRAANGARVVAVSSAINLTSPVVFDDIHFHYRDFSGMSAYGQAKTANALFAVGANQRWADEGILANAAAPGVVLGTRISRFRTPEQEQAFRETHQIPADVQKTFEQGAATPVFAAASPYLEGIGGLYLDDCREADVLDGRDGVGFSGVAPYALDRANADRLWVESERILAGS